MSERGEKKQWVEAIFEATDYSYNPMIVKCK